MISVPVILGSQNDETILNESGFVEILERVLQPPKLVDVRYAVYSAHRDPEDLAEYVAECLLRYHNDPTVFVGIAGLAAALPGAVAGLSEMKVPVIGVPLDQYGIDSCLHMPPGVPVLLPGVGKKGLQKAAHAVCQIVATSHDGVAQRLKQYLEETAKPSGPFNPSGK